jgi:PPOX class probable F420-dependent enzyme
VELSEALPFIKENHLAVVVTVTKSGRGQSTVVSAGWVDGKVGFVSQDATSKVKNAKRNGRCAVTLIKPDTRRYATVEGPVEIKAWADNSEADMLALLRKTYSAAGRDPDTVWEDFDADMREQKRSVLLVEPASVYGSLRVRG